MSYLLSAIQSNLEETYEVSVPQKVVDFVITDKNFVEIILNKPIESNSLEQLLVASNGNNLDISLYLDSDLVSRLGNNYPCQNTDQTDLHDFWIALEGVSHFLYLVWNAGFDRQVSQLELELQAEVDKFVSVTNAITHGGDTTRMQEIWSLLFSNPKFKNNLEQENFLRYQKANAYASQYCLNLMEMNRTTTKTMQNELRRFYRLSQNAKISRIDNFANSSNP